MLPLQTILTTAIRVNCITCHHDSF